MEQLNTYELRYKRTKRWVISLTAMWVVTLLLFVLLDRLLPKSVSKSVMPLLFATVPPALFVAMLVVGAMNLVAYIRWTGKYPYYFLFKRPRGGDSQSQK